jgi:membrane-bound lytic murein transglycosylase F
MRLAIRLSSPLWSYFEKLQRIVPNLRLDALPSDLDRASALRLVADGVYDATVLPIALGDDDLEAYPRLKRLFDLTDDQPFGWFLRSDRRVLLRNLNRFIARYHTANFEPALAPRDFAAIQRRGVLRVVTRVDPQNYFVTHGGPSGYEYELVNAFAQAQGLKLQVMVANSDHQMLEWLKTGAADIVSTRLDANFVRGDPSVSFSRSYHHTAYTLLTSRRAPIMDATVLRNKLVLAYDHSPEFRAARSAALTTGLKVVPAASELPAVTLLERVAKRDVDALVVDGETADRIVASNPALRAGVSLPDQFEYRWLLRGGDPKLLNAINAFLVKSHQQGLDATLVARYFTAEPTAKLVANKGRAISPFDRLMRMYAERYDFDWRLIAAQIYQESRFDPRAVSSGGATGLMQMLPTTAKSLGFRNIFEPETSIHAGVRYLYELRNEFQQEIPAGERTWFALAAYNAGFERVERARRLAEKLRLDPNKWFGNVESAMLKLARPTNGAKRGRGYGQAIIYVRQIQSLYGTYLQLGDATQQRLTGDLTLSSRAAELSAYSLAMTP